MIRRVIIQNYRRFRYVDVEMTEGLNIIVGDNDAGKSTLLEAINLALTGRLGNRWLSSEISPHLVNREAAAAYIEDVKGGKRPTPPDVVVEVYFDRMEEGTVLEGGNNLAGGRHWGVRIQACFDTEYIDEYEAFIADPAAVRQVPTEYYRVDWLGFSGSPVTQRSLPSSVAVIDPAAMRLGPGVDRHLQHIISTHLDPKERVELSREYRSLREEFDDKEAVKEINSKLKGEDSELTDRDLSLSIDISQRYTWEGSVSIHLDRLPLQLVGKGEQNTVKTLLAIGHRAADKAIVLIEEPETHLSYSRLRELLARIERLCEGKQVIVATHSAYVLNKLGLDAILILASDGQPKRLTDLSQETVSFFKRLPGHDTLRLVLSKGAILVEGASDELVVLRAYRDKHDHEPLDDGKDIISVGTSHKRYMELGLALGARVWAIRDNDGRTPAQMAALFDGHTSELVTLHHGVDPNLETLDPQILACNELQTISDVLNEDFDDDDAALKWMTDNKTEAALRILESDTPIEMPEYIRDVC